MANELTLPPNFGTVPAIFQGQKDKLSEGIAAGYGIIGYKGKVWSIRFRGDETALMRADGSGPMNAIEAIIVEAADHISKIFYEGGYVEGNTAPPDCFSNDGLAPDVSSPKKQNAICATCPRNAWGSATNKATGGKGKACGDFKRTAVVPLQDPKNEVFGGPMLLRIPAASLQDAAQYSKKMGSLGYPTFAIGTSIAFDIKESYPKFNFSPIRVLTEAEAAIVAEYKNGDIVQRILAENEVAQPAQAPAQAGPTIQATAQPVQQAPQQPVQPVQAPPPAQPTPAPVQPTQPAPTAFQTPTTQPVQQAKPTGFGGVAVAQSPVAQAVDQVVRQAAPATPAPDGAGGTGAADFDAELEKRLEALMPKVG